MIPTDRPRFTHDCDRCHWLGQFEDVDLWWCASVTAPSMDSVIARYGNKGREYAASHPPAAFADPEGYLRHAESWYHAALERAEAAGLYDPAARTRRKDRFGRLWDDLPRAELCPVCGQPDNCGDCAHEPLTDAQALQLGAQLNEKASSDVQTSGRAPRGRRRL